MDDPGGPDKLPNDLAPIDMPLYIAYNVTMDKGGAHWGRGTGQQKGVRKPLTNKQGIVYSVNKLVVTGALDGKTC